MKLNARITHQFTVHQFGLCITKAGTGCARFHQVTHSERGMRDCAAIAHFIPQFTDYRWKAHTCPATLR